MSPKCRSNIALYNPMGRKVYSCDLLHNIPRNIIFSPISSSDETTDDGHAGETPHNQLQRLTDKEHAIYPRGANRKLTSFLSLGIRLQFAAYISFGTHMEPLSMFEDFYEPVCLKLMRLSMFEASCGESLQQSIICGFSR